MDRPNLAGRLATLQVHTRNIRLAEDVNLRKIAIATAGTVGADLANLVNEAALRAVRLGRKAVNQEDLLAAFELVIAGAEKKGSVLSEFEKKLVAYHEVGHAMVAYRALSAIRSICRRRTSTCTPEMSCWPRSPSPWAAAWRRSWYCTP